MAAQEKMLATNRKWRSLRRGEPASLLRGIAIQLAEETQELLVKTIGANMALRSQWNIPGMGAGLVPSRVEPVIGWPSAQALNRQCSPSDGW
jgi:hypothetical protein